MQKPKVGRASNGFELLKSSQAPEGGRVRDLNGDVLDLSFLFGDLDDSEERPLTEQELRRNQLQINMNNQADALRRSAKLVDDILLHNQHRLQLDENGRLIIVGQLALYRMDLVAFLQKMSNPFSHHSFDMIEVHPKSALVDSPEKACVQVHQPSTMPAYDFLAGYILGLMNDESSWLTPPMEPLRSVLMGVYGLAKSPLTDSLERHLQSAVNGTFDHVSGMFTFDGTNGWRWRINYLRPLGKGYKLEYQKPRQTWWNSLFEDHMRETSGHHAMNSFLPTVEHLSMCPGMLKDCSSWDSDPVFIRKVALDYPPLRRSLMNELNHEHYNPEELSIYYDEQLSEREVSLVTALDAQLRQQAEA